METVVCALLCHLPNKYIYSFLEEVRVPRPRRDCTRSETRRSNGKRQTLDRRYIQHEHVAAWPGISCPLPSRRQIGRSVYLPEKLMAMCEYLLPLRTPRHLSPGTLPPIPSPSLSLYNSLPKQIVLAAAAAAAASPSRVSPIISRN